jgi:hypothetical protein
MSKKPAIAGALGLALAALAGYLVWAGYETRAERHEIVALVSDTTARLREALDAPSFAAEGSRRVEASYLRLRALKARRNPGLADGAEHYLLGAREILRRQEASQRQSRQAAASRAALDAHLRRAHTRNVGWIDAAMVLRKNAENDHFELDRTLRALAELLESLPDAAKRLAPHLEADVLLEESARERAHRYAAEQARRAARELERVRTLPVR